MVANIIYYMIKYKCIAAINEGPKVARIGDPNMKFALIASPNSLLMSDYITIKNSGLSDKAKELYSTVFNADLTKIYSNNYKDDYTKIWDEDIFSPYLMMNAEKLRDLFNSVYGRYNPNFIQNLR